MTLVKYKTQRRLLFQCFRSHKETNAFSTRWSDHGTCDYAFEKKKNHQIAPKTNYDVICNNERPKHRERLEIIVRCHGNRTDEDGTVPFFAVVQLYQVRSITKPFVIARQAA